MMKDKIAAFVNRGKEIKVSEFHPGDGFILPYIAGPKFDAWMTEIHLFNLRHLKKHPLYSDIEKISSDYKEADSPCEDMLTILRALLTDEELIDGTVALVLCKN